MLYDELEMEPGVNQYRQLAHDLLDGFPVEKLRAVLNLLEVMVEPRNGDEAFSEQDRERFQEGRRWFAERGGKGISMNEVLAEFGVTAQDFPLGK